MKKLLFFSADNSFPQCSFFQLGLSLNEFLQECKSIETTFFNSASGGRIYPPYDINKEFDLILFNYHFQVMAYLPLEFFQSITIPKLMVNYETRSQPWNSPCHIGSSAHYGVQGEPQRQLFDYMIIPDTSMDAGGDRTVLLLPRIIPKRDFVPRPVNMKRPVISTYGLPSGYKDIPGMYNAVAGEFDRAIFRIHFPPDSRSNSNAVMSSMLGSCNRPNVEIQFTDNFMDHDYIPEWLNQSDLNIFFYHAGRDQVTEGTFPGSIDFAITAQRPIAVSDNICTRYLHKYIDPYPKKSLRQIMELGCLPIEKAYEDGTSGEAVKVFDEWIGTTFN